MPTSIFAHFHVLFHHACTFLLHVLAHVFLIGGRVQDEDIDTLEMDLEKLLDAEESRRDGDTLPDTCFDKGFEKAGVAETAVDPEMDTQPGLGLDLEFELEAMMDESGSLLAVGRQRGITKSLFSSCRCQLLDSLDTDLAAILHSQMLEGACWLQVPRDKDTTLSNDEFCLCLRRRLLF